MYLNSVESIAEEIANSNLTLTRVVFECGQKVAEYGFSEI